MSAAGQGPEPERDPAIAAATAALALRQLARGESVTLRARGASMWPWLLDGDVLTLQPRTGPPRLGEIVLLRQGDFGVIHRVVGRLGGRYAVKGDALPRLDGLFPAADLPARVSEVRRGAERFTPLRALPLATSWARLRGL